MPKLEDVLTTGLDLVICGSAASSVSAERGQYYAGPGNRFWTNLRDVGLTDRLLDPSEYRSLLGYGIGLTDVVKDQSGMDSAIDFDGWGALLRGRLEPYSPAYLCFNGKRAASEAIGEKRIRYGLHATSFGSTRLFVAPSTSAAARRWWDGGIWRELAELVRSATRPRVERLTECPPPLQPTSDSVGPGAPTKPASWTP
jgi:TDG/mug DNA glycosylase family protein